MTISRTLALLLIIAALPSTLHAQQVLPLWPNGTPEPAHTTGPERDDTKPTDKLVAGRPVIRLTDVATPTLTLYPAPNSTATTPGVVVFPGGGYSHLAFDLEGTEICAWMNTLNITCAVVRYRVPEKGMFPENTEDLEDAQQALRLLHSHAADWHLDPQRIGIMGFSAGGHLSATLSNHFDWHQPGVAAPQSSARPAFVILIYPAYLVPDSDLTHLKESLQPTANTPPTFLVQTEDDPIHVENALFYYAALKQAHVPAELHLFPAGGHGYGLRPTNNLPIFQWPTLAAAWLRSIHILTP